MSEDEGVADPDALSEVHAFQAFLADIKDRCEVRPAAAGASAVGSYG